jgi:CBS domain-containing protein
MGEVVKRLGLEKVRDASRLMALKPAVLLEDAPIEKVLGELVEDPKRRIVCVVDSDRKLVGVISLTELLIYIGVHAGEAVKSFAHLTPYEAGLRYMMGNQAKHVMRAAISVKSDDNLLDALNLMERSGLEELPIVDDQGKVVGEIHALEIFIETLKLLE